MKFIHSIILLTLFTSFFTGCKKEEDTETGQSNINAAPSNYNQVFEFEVTVERNRVVELIQNTGVTQVSKTTFKYTEDTIYETRFEFGSKTLLRKHRINADLVTATVDSIYGKDTVEYIQEITYTYGDGENMSLKSEAKYRVYPDSISAPSVNEWAYLYKNGNLLNVDYISPDQLDSTNCIDEYTHNSMTAKYDVQNLMGIDEGSKSNNLKATLKHATYCAGNGKNGSTQYEYWYELDTDNRITTIVYRRTHNSTAEVFRENYKYINR
jgi:hypothetical protein